MPSKKVSMRASMANQTSHFGIMGGLYNRKISGRSSTNRATSRLTIPAGADAGLRYMKMHNLLSRNPVGSGGVGRMFTVRPRGSGGSGGSYSRKLWSTTPTDNLGEPTQPPAAQCNYASWCPPNHINSLNDSRCCCANQIWPPPCTLKAPCPVGYVTEEKRSWVCTQSDMCCLAGTPAFDSFGAGCGPGPTAACCCLPNTISS